MGRKIWRVTIPLDSFYYFGLIAIGRKLAREGKLKGFKGGASKIGALAVEVVVDSYIETGQITREEIERLMEEERV